MSRSITIHLKSITIHLKPRHAWHGEQCSCYEYENPTYSHTDHYGLLTACGIKMCVDTPNYSKHKWNFEENFNLGTWSPHSAQLCEDCNLILFGLRAERAMENDNNKKGVTNGNESG